MHAAFWKGRRVLLTGHTGFKGSWLALWLQHLGAEVTGLSLEPPTAPSLFEVATVAHGMRSLRGDIRDQAAVEGAVSQAVPEVLLHLAAQALVRPSYQDPLGTYTTNVIGTLNVLLAARQAPNLRSILIVTTDKCYENREWQRGYSEQDPMGGHDPYSSSKGCAELLTASMRSSYFPAARHPQHGIAVASARAGNVIGGGDWAVDRLVPDILRGIQSTGVATLRNPSAVRPWQHVLDPLAGYLTLAERLHDEGPSVGEAWNFGPDDADAWSVRQVADRVVAAWGDGASVQEAGGGGPHEAHWLKLDAAKARRRLGWRPRWNVGQAIDRTVAWARAHARGADMRKFTLEQILEYEACT